LGSTRQIVKIEYIRQQVPPLPTEPEYYSVQFKSVEWAPGQYDYYLDPENAKNLLKNRELDKGYQEEMKEILQGLIRQDSRGQGVKDSSELHSNPGILESSNPTFK
jgi:hypothetical protein